MSCDLHIKTEKCGPSDFGACRTLGEMIDIFLKDRFDRPEREKAWWGDKSLHIHAACERAFFTLGSQEKRDSHQWVFSKIDLKAMAMRVAAHGAQLENARTFCDLYSGVENALGLDRNQRPLLVYDAARRLAYRLDLEPEDVYLHAGPKKGANALRRGLGKPRRRPLSDFPTSIRTRLTPAQAEDFLCLASKHLRIDLWD